MECQASAGRSLQRGGSDAFCRKGGRRPRRHDLARPTAARCCEFPSRRGAADTAGDEGVAATTEPLRAGPTRRGTLGQALTATSFSPFSTLVAASNRVTFPPQIGGELHLHLQRRFIRHWIQMRIKLRHQTHPVFLHCPGRFITVLVVLESMLRRYSTHADVEAWLRRIALRIGADDRSMFRDPRIQQDDVDVVVKLLRFVACP